MKTGTIASTLVAMSLGAFLTACGGAEISDGSQIPEEQGTSGELMSEFEPEYVQIGEAITSCDDTQYDHWRNLAALAVASANELGRWNAAKDFVKAGNGIQLSQEALSRCQNGCENIKAILELQNDVTRIIPRHDPPLLRQYMVSFLDRQINWNRANPVPDHTLKLASVTNDVCGFRYHYDVVGTTTPETTTTTTPTNTNTWGGTTAMQPTHSWQCVSVQGAHDYANTQQESCKVGPAQQWTVENKGGSNYQFRNGPDKCLSVNGWGDGAQVVAQSCNGSGNQLFTLNHKGSNNFELRNVATGKCLDIATPGTRLQVYSCTGSANQTFNMPSVAIGGGSQSSTTTKTKPGAPLKPKALWDQLKFAGELENKFLMFQYTDTQASIDPMATMISGGSNAKSGSCAEGATVFSDTNVSNDCCVVNGKYGKLVVSTWNKKLYYCK